MRSDTRSMFPSSPAYRLRLPSTRSLKAMSPKASSTCGRAAGKNRLAAGPAVKPVMSRFISPFNPSGFIHIFTEACFQASDEQASAASTRCVSTLIRPSMESSRKSCRLPSTSVTLPFATETASPGTFDVRSLTAGATLSSIVFSDNSGKDGAAAKSDISMRKSGPLMSMRARRRFPRKSGRTWGYIEERVKGARDFSGNFPPGQGDETGGERMRPLPSQPLQWRPCFAISQKGAAT